MDDLILKYKKDPVAFIEEVIGCKLTSFQKDFIRFLYANKDKQIYLHTGRSNWRSSMKKSALLMRECEEMVRRMMLNPDKDYVAKVRSAVKENEGHCPCELERSKDTLCPCKNMREKQICHCNLYVERNVGPR